MGGPGSGGWGREATRILVEQTLQLDIRYLCRKQLLGGASHTVFWWPERRSIVPIQVRAHGSLIQVVYTSRNPVSGGRRSVREYIGTTRTPCNFGGHRIWWVCPGCESRVANLAFKSGRIGCRHCFDLIYACQREGSTDRLLRAAQKSRARLGKDWWIKPKGMHWATYQRLASCFLAREQLALAALRCRIPSFSERMNL